MMKKLITLILFISLSFNLYSQKVNVEIDAFTGEKTVSTSWENLHSVNAYYYRFTEYNGNIYFEFASPTFDISVFSADDTIKFKSDNDEILTLYNQEYKISSKGGGSIASFWLTQNISVHLHYKIDKQNLNFLKNNLIKLVRYDYDTIKGGKHRDAEIDSKSAKKLQSTYKMFINEINKTSE